MPTRKRRGFESQETVAAFFRPRGWPSAEAPPRGRRGVDVLGMPGLSVEVKARRDFRLPEWLRQAGTRPGVPFVVLRPDGYGPEKVEQWAAILRLDDMAALLTAAGYAGEDTR